LRLGPLLGANSTDEVAHSASNIWDSTVRALPRIGIAVMVIVVAWGLGRLARAGLDRVLRHRHTPSFSTVMAKLAGWGITTVGVLLALAVTFPSVKPVDLLAGLGFFSVAVGFAFQDILENLLAGILLLFRQPFVGGDQIQVGEHEGTVDRITIRETVLTTFDGARVLIPNASVYKNAVDVRTARPSRRTSFVVGVAYDTDLDRARALAVDALAGVDGVHAEPAPEALLAEFAPSTVDIDIRYWTLSEQHHSRIVLDRAMAAVKRRFDDAKIEMPTSVVSLQLSSGQ
jgi:small conductance mechanosensitive channel